MGACGQKGGHQPTTVSRQLEKGGRGGACRGPSRPGGRREGNLSGERGEGGAVAAAAAQQTDEEAAESGA